MAHLLGRVDAVAATCATAAFLAAYNLLKVAFRTYPPGIVVIPRPGGIRGFLLQHGVIFRRENAGEPVLRWVREHGGQPVAYSITLPVIRVCIPHPEDVYHVLVTNGENYVKPPEYKMMSLLLGNGLVTQMDEDVHRAHRRLVSPAFSPAAIRKMANDVMRDHSARMMKGIVPLADGTTLVDLPNCFNDAALGIIAETAFKTDILTEPAVAKSFQRVNDALRLSPLGVLLTAVGLPNKTSMFARAMKMSAEQCVRRILASPKCADDKKSKVLIDFLIDAGKAFTTEQLSDHAITFMFAGFDTSSTGLTWIAYHLAKYPAVQEKLFEEISATMSFDTCASVDELLKLPYLRAVINETMRVCPVVTNVGRCAVHDDILPHSKVHLPPGAPLHISPYVTHRLKEVWGEDADEYRPERWEAPDFEENLPPGAFIPFVAGKRNCIGKDFAFAEMSIILAMLVRRVKIAWPPGQADPQRVPGIVIKLRQPMNFLLTLRS